MELNLKTKMFDYLKANYPDDPECDHVNHEITFEEILNCLKTNPDKFYDVTEIKDSIVREYVFDALAEILDIDYNDIYDMWLGESKLLAMEGHYDEFNVVMSYVLEGMSLSEARSLYEDTLTPDTVNKVELAPSYKKLKGDIAYYFKAVDGIEGYRDGDFRKHPIESLKGEAEFCQDVADYLGRMRVKGFSPETSKNFMAATAADVEYLDNSAKRLRNILAKQDDSLYLNDDGTVNKKTNQKPGEYARRALRKLRDFFARIGNDDWEFDPDFDYKGKTKEVDYSDLVADYIDTPVNYNAESVEWKQDVRFLVDECVKQGLTLRSVKEVGMEQGYSSEQLEYFMKYTYHLFS